MNYKIMVAFIVNLFIFFNATAMNESLKRKLSTQQSGKKIKINSNEFNDEMPGLEELPSNVIKLQESVVPEIDMPGLEEVPTEGFAQLTNKLKTNAIKTASIMPDIQIKNNHTLIVEYTHHGEILYFICKE